MTKPFNQTQKKSRKQGGKNKMSYFKTKYGDNLYVVFRICVGALYFMFGIQKIFGLWGMAGNPAPFGTLIWYAGMGELLIGLALVFGVLTRLASAFGIIEMLVAYLIGHVSTGGWNPAVNMGAPALLFALAFLMTFVNGSKKASVELAVSKKEIF